MQTLYQIFIAPFGYSFMVHALIMGLVVAVLCATLSCFIILKGWSLMGDAISHAVLPGIVLAYAGGLPLAIGAFVAGLLCAACTGFLTQHSRIKQDTSMGIVFSGFFALGLLLFSQLHTTQHITHILFGSLLGIPRDEFIQTLIVALVVVAVLLIRWKDLLVFCFDEMHAQVIGLSVPLLRYTLLGLLALTIVASMRVVGVILVVAMLIAPGAIAFMLVKRFKAMVIIAVIVSAFSTYLGITLSFHWGMDTGPAIVVLQSLIFLVMLIAQKAILSAGSSRHRLEMD